MYIFYICVYVYLHLYLYLYLSIHNIFMTLIFNAFNDLHRKNCETGLCFIKVGPFPLSFEKLRTSWFGKGPLCIFWNCHFPKHWIWVYVCVCVRATWVERAISWISLRVTACSVFQKMLLWFPLSDPFTGLKFPQLLWVLAAEGSQMSPLLGKSLWANWGATSPRNLVRGGHSQWLIVKGYTRLALRPQFSDVVNAPEPFPLIQVMVDFLPDHIPPHLPSPASLLPSEDFPEEHLLKLPAPKSPSQALFLGTSFQFPN